MIQSKAQGVPTVSTAYPLGRVTRQLLAGKDLVRSLFNLAVDGRKISGKVLDLGSKAGTSSYYRFLDIADDAEIVYTDFEGSGDVVRLDVEEPFPFPDATFDFVLAFHLFEHVFHFDVAPREIFRILKPGGSVLLSVPFVHEYHADPSDYFRFSDSAIHRIWTEAGFECVHLEAIGEGFLSTFVTKIPGAILPRVTRPYAISLCYLATVPLDRIINRVRPLVDGKTLAQRFALEHFAIFTRDPDTGPGGEEESP